MAQSKHYASYEAFSFDVFGTIINWEAGAMRHVQLLAEHLPSHSPLRATPFPLSTPRPGAALPPKHPLMDLVDKHERIFMEQQPLIPFEEIMHRTFLAVAEELHTPWPRDEIERKARVFSSDAGMWPAFSDSVEALRSLGRGGAGKKLIAITNCSNGRIRSVMDGPLKDVEFDAVYTAEEAGAYKPSPTTFKFLLNKIEEDFNVSKDTLLHVAHGVQSDQVPAEEMGIDHAWVERGFNNWADASRDGMQRLTVVPDLKNLADVALGRV